MKIAIVLGTRPEIIKLSSVIREFGEDTGVVYIDKPEDVIAKAIELIQNGSVAELGLKARESREGGRGRWA